LPIAFGGMLRLGGSGFDADTFVLALPLATGHSWLALLTYLGGLSAASSMIIVETIALSVMMSNHLLMPLLVRGGSGQPARQGRWFVYLGQVALESRRLAVVLVLASIQGWCRLPRWRSLCPPCWVACTGKAAPGVAPR
jgi:Na+/proline symporter